MPKKYIYTTIAVLFAFGLMFSAASCGKAADKGEAKPP